MQFVGSRGTPIPIGPLVAGRGQPMLDEPPLWADEVITIPDRSTVNVDVTLQRGVRVNGRVELIGAAPTPPGPAGAPLLRFTVNLASLGSVPWVQQSTIAPDGRSFSVFGSGPGKYTMSTPSMAGLTVRSVTIGGQDVTDLPVDLGTRDLNDVVVTFTSEQRGSIAIATSAPPAGQAPLDDVALVFPADRRYWAFPTSALPRYANLPLTSKGTATVSNLPGGDYYVLLVPPHESVNWQETTRMEALSRRAQIVTVLEGQKKTVEVKR
jgi:hypothetical protein